MLETLTALLEKVVDPTRRRTLYFQILGDVIGTICSQEAQYVFSSAQNLARASASKKNLNSGVVPSERDALERCIEALSTFVSVARRVAHPALPDEVWTQSLSFTQDQLAASFPLADVWAQVLPTILAATNALHGLWAPSTRWNITTTDPELAGIFAYSAGSVDTNKMQASVPLTATHCHSLPCRRVYHSPSVRPEGTTLTSEGARAAARCCITCATSYTSCWARLPRIRFSMCIQLTPLSCTHWQPTHRTSTTNTPHTY